MRYWILIAGACALAAGCSGGSSTDNSSTSTTSSNASGQKYTIAVIPKGSTHEYWKSVHAGADAAAKELGVTIDWKGPVKEDDRESQVKTVEDFITAKVSGIVLAPLDDKALVPPVNDAVKAGIPVVIIDSGLSGGDYTSFVATDNEKGGQMAADEMAKVLNGKGRVVVLRYEEGSASTMLREKGFLEEIAKTPGIKVLDSSQYGGATVETAQKASENLLARYHKPDGSLDLEGIYTPNESTTFGMLLVLQSMGQAGKVKFVGFDSSETLVNALTKGQIDALVVQNPFQMAHDGVTIMVKHLKGETVPKAEPMTPTLVTKDNVGDPAMQKIVNPPKE